MYSKPPNSNTKNWNVYQLIDGIETDEERLFLRCMIQHFFHVSRQRDEVVGNVLERQHERVRKLKRNNQIMFE